MTNWTLERVATEKEKAYAQETEQLMVAAGFSGTYGGGSRSKGNGFWLIKGRTSLGYKNCRVIRSIIKNS